MNTQAAAPTPKCSRAQVREAAVWLALLHGPDRSTKVERGFRRWMAAKPEHAVAFEKISLAWETTGALPRGPLPRLTRWQRAGFRQGFRFAAATLASVAVVAALGIAIYINTAGVATAVGEQRILTLDDGTRVYLNTDTRVLVKYDDRQRAVELKSGEALFEVVKNSPTWPFVVRVESREIRAVGTAFVVRRDPNRLAVTLVEGKVAVQNAERRESAPILLSAGQRVTLTDESPPAVDEPAIEKVTAWRSGHVDLFQVPLGEAMAEMNRYSRVKVHVEERGAATILITGIFRAGDTLSFAQAVAESYGLQVIERSNGVTLAGRPNSNPK